MCRAHFGDDAWPADGRTRTDQWNCAPSSPSLRPLATLMISTRTGTGFLAAFRVVNGPLRRSPTPSRQLGVAPEGRSGVVAGAGAVAKRRPVPIGGSACGGAHCSRLTRPFRARRTGFLFVVLFDGVPVEPFEGANRYPMAAYTSVRRRTGTVDISKAVNHRESAFLAPGRHDRSTIRLEVYFFLATRASRIAGR